MVFPMEYHEPQPLPPLRRYQHRLDRANGMLRPIKKPMLIAQAFKSKAKKYRFRVTTFGAQYCEKSTVHGLRYFVDGTLNRLER